MVTKKKTSKKKTTKITLDREELAEISKGAMDIGYELGKTMAKLSKPKISTAAKIVTTVMTILSIVGIWSIVSWLIG